MHIETLRFALLVTQTAHFMLAENRVNVEPAVFRFHSAF
jgi:hypothetical protein